MMVIEIYLHKQPSTAKLKRVKIVLSWTGQSVNTYYPDEEDPLKAVLQPTEKLFQP